MLRRSATQSLVRLLGHWQEKPSSTPLWRQLTDALRLLILRTMAGFDRAFSLADLEEELDTVDKSTLFRTLTLFLAHHLVHGIDDGTGSLKYALCSSDCDCEIDDLHTHFYCTHCRRTFCLRGVAVPQVGLPDGFSAETINFVIKGICADCSGRN